MVRLSEHTSEKLIKDLSSRNKTDALHEMVELIANSNLIDDIESYKESILERERILSTGIGLEVAVPHAKNFSVKDFAVAIGRVPDGIEFDSMDGEPVKLIFMIAGPESEQKKYLKILSRISLIARNEELKDNILKCTKPVEIYDLLKEY